MGPFGQADKCSICSYPMGWIGGMRGFGLRERRHEPRCKAAREAGKTRSLMLWKGSDVSNGSPLDSMLQGCHALKCCNLPPEAADLLLDIEHRIERLTPLLQNSNDVLKLWPRPLPQEQLEWSQMYPEGGDLLHTQACVGRVGLSSTDLFVARLFISEDGIAVQTSIQRLGSIQNADLRTGLVLWDGIEISEVDKCEVVVSFKQRVCGCQSVRLQLGSAAACDKVKQAYTHFSIDTAQSFQSFKSCISFESSPQRKKFVPLTFHQPSNAPVTQTFLASSGALQVQESVHDTRPLCSSHVPNVTLEDIRWLLERDDDWFLCRFQVDVLEAKDLALTPWAPGQHSSDTKIRRLCSKLPSPKDVPKTISNLIGFPENMNNTLAARLSCTDNRITLLMRSCALNVPYGDCQMLEDVLVFTPCADGGVNISKFVRILWIKSVPFALKMARSFLENKIKQEGSATFGRLVHLLQRECARRA